jgi:DNA-binding NtrC family response regulator
MYFDSSPASKGRVLLVEDDEDTRATLSEALEELGFRVDSHRDGVAALERARGREFDVVLTDLRMPNMDGLELCRRLSGDQPKLPVVLMTAFGDLETALGALRAGAFDFIVKPFSVDQVVEALTRGVQQRAETTPPAAEDSREPTQAQTNGRRRESLEDVERRHIHYVLDAVAWNKAEAARTLGIDRATLYRKLRRYNIERPS